MSSVKDEMARRAEVARAGSDIALKAGAIRSCPIHEDMLIVGTDQAAVPKAEAAGRRLHKKQPGQYDLDELLAAIRSAINGAPEECPLCPGESD